MVARRDVLGVLAGVAMLAAGCGSAERDGERDALVLDWEQGEFAGIQLGDRDARLRRVLGPPLRRGAAEPFQPIGEDFYAIGGLTNFKSPTIGRGSDTLRYRRRVFLTTGGRVSAWGTTDPRARTPEGVGIGDDQALVERRFRHASCATQNAGTEYATYPLCRVRVCAGRLLGFGGDPIRSIWLAAETRRALGRCRSR